MPEPVLEPVAAPDWLSAAESPYTSEASTWLFAVPSPVDFSVPPSVAAGSVTIAAELPDAALSWLDSVAEPPSTISPTSTATTTTIATPAPISTLRFRVSIVLVPLHSISGNPQTNEGRTQAARPR